MAPEMEVTGPTCWSCHPPKIHGFPIVFDHFLNLSNYKEMGRVHLVGFKCFLETSLDCVGKAFAGAGRAARAVQKTLAPDGINILQANGPGAKQSVFHLHVHVIPRGMDDGLSMNWELAPGDKDQIGRLAEQIASNVE